MAAQGALRRLDRPAAGGARRRGAAATRATGPLLAAALLALAPPALAASAGPAAAAAWRAAEPGAAVATLVAHGDAAWNRRADGRRAGRADPGPIGEAVSAYERALTAAPDDLAVRVRLLRALYFQGRFATPEGAGRRAVYARGRDLAEQGIARLSGGLEAQPLDPGEPEAAAALAGRPEAAGLFFWAAAHWGLWGEAGGALAAARQGVAGKVRDRAEVVIRLDERYEAAGGLRIRGRLHTEAPRIPLVTGWVDRDEAVRSLERAVELAPREPLNRLYLAEALLRFRPRRRAEALALLDRLLAEAPRPGVVMEDEAALEDARRTAARFAG